MANEPSKAARHSGLGARLAWGSVGGGPGYRAPSKMIPRGHVVAGIARLKPRYSGVNRGLGLSFPTRSQSAKAPARIKLIVRSAWVNGLSQRRSHIEMNNGNKRSFDSNRQFRTSRPEAPPNLAVLPGRAGVAWRVEPELCYRHRTRCSKSLLKHDCTTGKGAANAAL